MRCRVLDLSTQDGAKNTALDMVLLENAEKKQELTIVFKCWEPTVLIGNSQSLLLDVDQESCKRHGVPIVRRFSGGQAVYIDNSYISFAVVGPRILFPVNLTGLRRQLCDAMVQALREFKIPVIFHEPDNLIVSSPRIRTLGNSGQIIKLKSVALQASIRYDLEEKNLHRMLELLRTNGQSLLNFKVRARNALAGVSEFTTAKQDAIKEALLRKLLETYNYGTFYEDTLTPDEIHRIKLTVAYLRSRERLDDKETYRSRGVCYFYLDGRCIIPEIAELLPYNRPSMPVDSTIT
ncbi:lipoate--protein ligase family protein [Patescibacteria group bacterium]|nr:lipoate--protein ligase family protein [Patescibacteria group bacterium]